MFSILTPILAITCAQLYSELINQKRYLLALIFVGIVIIQAFVALPNAIFAEDSWVFGLPRIILLSSELVFCAVVLVTFRRSLELELIRKKKYLVEYIQDQ
jgi:hypothetical protein